MGVELGVGFSDIRDFFEFVIRRVIPFIIITTLKWSWFILLLAAIGAGIVVATSPKGYFSQVTFAVAPTDTHLPKLNQSSDLTSWAEHLSQLVTYQEEELLFHAAETCQAEGTFSARQNGAFLIVSIIAKTDTDSVCLLDEVVRGFEEQIALFIPDTITIRQVSQSNGTQNIWREQVFMVGGWTAAITWLLILFLTILDDTVKNSTQVEAKTGLPTLASIAFIDNSDSHRENLLIAHNRPRHPTSEAYRQLRTSIDFATINGPIQTLLIASATPREGRSITAANLAVVVAQSGKQTVLVDTDLRRPIQHHIFSLSNNIGVTTAILDQGTPIGHHLQETKVSNLRVMPSGPIPPNPAELLNSQRMRQVIDELKDKADIIIFDSSPASIVADAAILAGIVDASVLVVAYGAIKPQVLATTSQQLQSTQTLLLGVVFNRIPKSEQYKYPIYGVNKRRKSQPPQWLKKLMRE